MRRKSRDRLRAKYYKGLSKRLCRIEMDDWDSELEDARHHILKLFGEVK